MMLFFYQYVKLAKYLHVGVNLIRKLFSVQNLYWMYSFQGFYLNIGEIRVTIGYDDKKKKKKTDRQMAKLGYQHYNLTFASYQLLFID